MVALRNAFPAVRHGPRLLYGGDQTLSGDRTVRSCGCGVIACLDLLLYLCRFHACRAERLEPLVGQDPISAADYDCCTVYLKQHYFPLIPHHGINGLFLAAGLNRVFRRCRMPYHARWGVAREHFWPSIEEMLLQDLPVILSIGPNFPLFWQHNTLQLHKKSRDSYVPAGKINAHYVSVTGMDEKWLRVSSWGLEYYISKSAYENYVKAHSARLVSNILWIESK